jgi:uncharacterized protein
VRKKSWPEPPARSPLPFRERSNGEFAPEPPTAEQRAADERVHQLADAVARRRGTTRRQVLASSLGTTAALSVVNLVACRRDPATGGPKDGPTGGTDTGTPYYQVPDTGDVDALCEDREVLDPDVFVFDLQTHHVDTDPDAAWMSDVGWLAYLNLIGASLGCAAPNQLDCVGQSAYVDLIFGQSDTTVAVLTTPPAPQGAHPLDNEHIRQTRELVDLLADSQRLLVHAGILPNTAEGELDQMVAVASALRPDAWKVYTQWGPTGTGWFLDDEVGTTFCERVLAVDGPNVICVHKGLPFAGMVPEHASPRDIGPAAAAFPEIQFVVYHSARDNMVPEGPYTEADADGGSNRLVKALLDAGMGPNGNVWAELGSAWNSLVTRPEEAAHLLGKMLLYVGEDRVVWGTDCLWYGSPQPFIEAFLAFQIPEALQEQHGYPALTDALKRRILGLNGAALHGVDPDEVRCTLADGGLARWRRELPADRPTGPRAFGPRNRRELAALWARHGGRPG